MIPIEEIYRLFLKYPRISTDSRNVIRDSLFFGIRGDQFNGNRFGAEALRRGAAFAISDDPSVIENERFILVPDTLQALRQLAVIHRGLVKTKIIGITGSNGKTTTKELIGNVLSSTFNTVITQGNLNNHLGVPLTILTLKKETEFAVIEMGANHPGEIANLCSIARPGFGIITNIGKAHLEGFGSFEGVVKAKSELYDFLRQSNGIVFLNLDNKLLKNLSAGMKLFSYGSGEIAGCKGVITNRYPFLEVAWSSGNMNGQLKSRLFGDYNFENIMAAIAIGIYFGVEQEKFENAISSYQPENNRSQVTRTDHNVLIMDAYNANPSSMTAALRNFREFDAPAKMIVLGDMMELGDYSFEEHMDIIKLVRKLDFQQVCYIGNQFSLAAKGGNELCFTDTALAEKWFLENPVRDMTILMKGSRKMQLEKLSYLF